MKDHAAALARLRRLVAAHAMIQVDGAPVFMPTEGYPSEGLGHEQDRRPSVLRDASASRLLAPRPDDANAATATAGPSTATC